MEYERHNETAFFQFDAASAQLTLTSTPFYDDGKVAEYSFDITIERDGERTVAFSNIDTRDAERIAAHLLTHKPTVRRAREF